MLHGVLILLFETAMKNTQKEINLRCYLRSEQSGMVDVSVSLSSMSQAFQQQISSNKRFTTAITSFV